MCNWIYKNPNKICISRKSYQLEITIIVFLCFIEPTLDRLASSLYKGKDFQQFLNVRGGNE